MHQTLAKAVGVHAFEFVCRSLRCPADTQHACKYLQSALPSTANSIQHTLISRRLVVSLLLQLSETKPYTGLYLHWAFEVKLYFGVQARYGTVFVKYAWLMHFGRHVREQSDRQVHCHHIPALGG